MKYITRFTLSLTAWLLLVEFCYPQWVQTNGPYGGDIRALAVSGTNLFAGTDGSGVFLSTNNGTSWTATGLTNTVVWSFAVSGTNLFAGTYGGVFLSTNNGTSWTAVNTGLPTNANVYGGFAVSGSNLFAGTYPGGVFLSTNNGTSWRGVNTGLTNTYVDALLVSGSNLFAGTDGGVFLSTNNGTSWTAVNTGLTNTYVNTLAVSGSNLFTGTNYGTNGGVFLSTNNGTSWTGVNTGLTNTYVNTLAVSGTNLFAGTYGGVWRRPLSEMITSVERLSSDVPTHFSLDQNYPNPFNPNTAIEFSLPHFGYVTLRIYNTLGQEVTTLAAENLPAGRYKVEWNANGLPSGVYLYRIQTGEFVETKKLILLK